MLAGLTSVTEIGAAFLLELHPQRVGESLDRVLGRGVVALQRDRAIGQRAADVDQRAAVDSQVRHGDARSVHDGPSS